jgi:hypothetical protein
MVSAQHIIRSIDAGNEVRRRPLVGMNFLHEPRVEVRFRLAQSSHKVSDLINFLVGHLAATRQTPPRCSVALRVFTPSGIPAIKVRCRPTCDAGQR